MTRRIRMLYWPTLLVLFLTSFSPLSSQTPRSARSLTPISTGWEFRQNNDSKLGEAHWYPATVPGQVHLDLLKNGLIPDPYYRDNEAKVQWIEEAAWFYRTSFQVSPEQLASTHLEMVFEGLDTSAEVFVNDKSVLKADNMFRTWRIDAKEFTLPPLSSAKYLSIPFQQLLNKEVPLDEQFVVTNLLVDGSTVSSNIVYLEPTKQVHLLPTTIQSSVTAHDGMLTVTLSSQVLARDVYITLGDLDATLSDNYFDLIPSESVKIDIQGNLTEQQVRDKMKIMSLVDAFPQAGTMSSQPTSPKP
jgi:beta-galactosidase/beta-glucuronidase